MLFIGCRVENRWGEVSENIIGFKEVFDVIKNSRILVL